MPHAEVNGARLYYEVHGEGVPLVLSHGGWTDTNHWPPPVAERMQRGIVGAELVVVAGAGHVPHLDDPALFNRTVEEFLLPVEGAG